MKLPIRYITKNFTTRRLTTAITVTGIALVVFVFSAVLMMAYGVEKTLVATGSDDNVTITRKAATGEISSIIGGDEQNVIRTLPYIAKAPDGSQIFSAEPVVIINLEKTGNGLSNVIVRGVSRQVLSLRQNARISEGRMFNAGAREIVVGESIKKNFKGTKIGDMVALAGDKWKVVGILSTGGSGFDSEIWGDSFQLLNAFNRGNSVSSFTLKLDRPENFENFKRIMSSEKRLQQYEAKTEKQFFEESSKTLSLFIRILGIFITVIFSIGATIGAMITMYAAVANRTVEVGTLRSLGFGRRVILIVFLLESMTIAAAGGLIGLFLASFLQFFSISTLNFGSFSELSFSFALSPSIVISSLIFAGVMGFFGGFLPSFRAARMNIVDALRAE
jgi:ABC-type antimicrobial peptide transport system permease subunit